MGHVLQDANDRQLDGSSTWAKLAGATLKGLGDSSARTPDDNQWATCQPLHPCESPSLHPVRRSSLVCLSHFEDMQQMKVTRLIHMLLMPLVHRGSVGDAKMLRFDYAARSYRAMNCYQRSGCQKENVEMQAQMRVAPDGTVSEIRALGDLFVAHGRCERSSRACLKVAALEAKRHTAKDARIGTQKSRDRQTHERNVVGRQARARAPCTREGRATNIILLLSTAVTVPVTVTNLSQASLGRPSPRALKPRLSVLYPYGLYCTVHYIVVVPLQLYCFRWLRKRQ